MPRSSKNPAHPRQGATGPITPRRDDAAILEKDTEMDEKNYPLILVDIQERLERGESVTPLSLAPKLRPLFHAAIIELSDKLPVAVRWKTLAQSHLNGTRLRIRTYSVRGQHVREKV